MPDSPEYEPILSAKASSFLIGLKKTDQYTLFKLLYQLAQQPSQVGDYSEQDASGRDVQFLLIGNYVITYWPDHAIKEFRVIDIELI